MPQTQTRIVGGGNTVLLVNGQRIAFLTAVSDTAPSMHGQAAAIQGIDDTHPVEIITPVALQYGVLTLTLVELWDEEAWERISGFAGTRTKEEVLRRNLQNDEIVCQKIIKQPNGDRRGRVYHGCKIVDVMDDDDIQLASMANAARVTMWYTHVTPF